MVRMSREFYRRAKGPLMNDESWWRLVLDGGRIFVEHEYDRVDVAGRGPAQVGTVEIDIDAFLDSATPGEPQRALLSLLDEIFQIQRAA
jgi:hypothetical protein